jgi:LmbE family N-acetylglucosaminyl deacetylase
VHLLDYRDRDLAAAPPDEIRRSLVSQIRRLRPLVVATFDANGFNLHADHVAISRFTTDAVAAAADPRWHPETGAPWLVPRLVWTPPIAAWEVGTVDRLEERPGVDFVIDVTEWRLKRVEALRAHRSQHLSIDRLFFNQPDAEERLRVEVWRQAWGPPLAARPASDLFAGMR